MLSSSMVILSHVITRINLYRNQHLIKVSNAYNESTNVVSRITAHRSNAPESNTRGSTVVGVAVSSETITKQSTVETHGLRMDKSN